MDLFSGCGIQWFSKKNMIMYRSMLSFYCFRVAVSGGGIQCLGSFAFGWWERSCMVRLLGFVLHNVSATL